MKFIVNTAELTKKLSVLSRIVSSNNIAPILSTILFQVGKDIITLTSSDGEITIQTRVSMDEWDAEEFSFVAPAKLLTDLLACMTTLDLGFELVRDSIVVDVPKGQYIFPSWDVKEFPGLPRLGGISEVLLSSHVLQQGIARTLFAMGDDELRPQINGVHIDLGNDISFASTDSYRISWVVGEVIIGNEEAQGFTISAKTANLINSLPFKGIEEVRLASDDITARFHVGEYDVYTRLVQEKFPPFKAVFPKVEDMKVLTTSKSALLGAIKRVAVFSNKTKGIIRVAIGSSVVISSDDADKKTKANETIPCAYYGEPLTIGFNKDFLAGVISNIESDEVTMRFSSPSKPVVFDYEHVKIVIIPLKID